MSGNSQKRWLALPGASRKGPMPVNWDDLLSTFEFVSFGQPGEHQAVLCRESDEFFCHSELIDMDEWPDDVDDEEKYLRIPHKKEFGLGKPLVFDFVEEFLLHELDEVRRTFNRKGAYARFKDLLQQKMPSIIGMISSQGDRKGPERVVRPQ
jgi:hypothetical protein